jgi:hypothetical protein
MRASHADNKLTRLRRRDADMRIGDIVIYRGKRCVLRGLDPMGVPDRGADIEDAATGELLRVRVAELSFD